MDSTEAVVVVPTSLQFATYSYVVDALRLAKSVIVKGSGRMNALELSRTLAAFRFSHVQQWNTSCTLR
jgi:hypothetical protein